MAIKLQKENNKREIPWFPIAMSLIILIFSGLAAYFLFWRPPPLIELLQRADNDASRLQQLQQFAVNPRPVLDDTVYQNIILNKQFLEEARNRLSPAIKGRSDPFAPFPTSSLIGR